MAKGKSVTVMLRSLTARLTMKNSAGFSRDLFWWATSSSREFPDRDRTPVGEAEGGAVCDRARRGARSTLTLQKPAEGGEGSGLPSLGWAEQGSPGDPQSSGSTSGAALHWVGSLPPPETLQSLWQEGRGGLGLQWAPGAGSGQSHLLQLEGARGHFLPARQTRGALWDAALMSGQGAGPRGPHHFSLAVSLLRVCTVPCHGNKINKKKGVMEIKENPD